MNNEMVISGNWNSFLDLPGEEILFVKRRHPFIIILPLALTSLLGTVFVFISYFIFTFILPTPPLFIATSLLIVSIAMSLMIYFFVYWYFHIYVLTNRKILEVWYTPLFSHAVNDIFLDKVNCTEIDLSSKGFFHELIDMGDITITFDRPTYQEQFILRDIKNCDGLGKFLTRKLMDGNRSIPGDTIWIRRKASYIPKPAI